MIETIEAKYCLDTGKHAQVFISLDAAMAYLNNHADYLKIENPKIYKLTEIPLTQIKSWKVK